MAEQYSIGRPTVRQATDMLVRTGLLERRRGSGTFVLPPSRSIDLFSLAGTSAALRESDLDADLELLCGPVRERSSATASDSENEGSEGIKDWFRIERSATVDSVPVLYETLWFDAELFDGLENLTLKNQSLSALVREKFFLEPSSADQTFYVIQASDEQAKRLAVSDETALLRVCRQLHFGEHRAALEAELVCRTDCFEFSQTLYPARAEQVDFKTAAS